MAEIDVAKMVRKSFHTLSTRNGHWRLAAFGQWKRLTTDREIATELANFTARNGVHHAFRALYDVPKPRGNPWLTAFTAGIARALTISLCKFPTEHGKRTVK